MLKPIRHVCVVVLTLGFVFSMFSMNYANEITKGIVIDKYAMVMEKPNVKAGQLTNIGLGEMVYIEENQGKWYKISTNIGMWGWVHSESIVVMDGEKHLLEDGIVNKGSMDIRENPNINSEIVGNLGFLSDITVVDKKNEWSHIAIGNEVIGWIRSEGIITSPSYPKGKTISESIEIKEEPSKESKVIKSVKKDTVFKIKDYKEGHFFVESKDGTMGWVDAREIKIMHKNFIMEKKEKKPEKNKEKPEEKSVTTYSDIIENATYLGGDYTAIAYDLSVSSCGKRVGSKYRGFTRTGINLNEKSWSDAMVIAVDQRQIPLGSSVLVLFDESDWRHKYNGVYLAGDTGGGIKGKKIDLYLGDIGNEQMPEVKNFGTTHNVKVYILN
ncbi:SH3-like domain-containing protein [Lutibacter sp. B2]|nr:SH3-like domain-containing protein [Lutibacter sp. B2]